MCDPDARRALISVGMAGSWMSRSVWANPCALLALVLPTHFLPASDSKACGRLADPILTRDGRELRLFFNGRNVDNRNRVDPVGAAGFPTSPLIEAACVAAHACQSASSVFWPTLHAWQRVCRAPT